MEIEALMQRTEMEGFTSRVAAYVLHRQVGAYTPPHKEHGRQ